MATNLERPGDPNREAESLGKPIAETGIFAVNGEYWTLGYSGTTFPLKDVKGLSYIRRLLQHPNEEFHALDLLGALGAVTTFESARVEKHESSLDVGVTFRRGLTGDSGEMLDAQAKQEYQRRLHELREELEDLHERGNHERAQQVESEIEFLEREIIRAVGIAGRDRRAGSNAERARLNVTRAIKAALEKIAEQQASMGELLDRSIKTGSFCSYVPDPRIQVTWQFSMQSSNPAAEAAATELAPRREASSLRSFAEGTAFAGREAERAILSDSLKQTSKGEGKIVLIGGPAGIGKTRLAAEIGAEASARGVLALAGSCYDRDDSVLFSPFVEILEAALEQAQSRDTFRDALGENASELAQMMPRLRRLFPDIPAPLELPPQQARRYLFESLCDFLARSATTRPVLLVLDDLHWADESTLSLLVHISRRISRMPVMIIGTFRDSEPDLGGALIEVLEDLLRTGVRPLRLKGLPEGSVAAMLRALSSSEPPAHLVRSVCEETDGNPFFVEELFKHLVEEGKVFDSSGQFRPSIEVGELDVPENVRLVVNRRLDRMSETTRQALASAAIIGRSFSFKLLESVAEADNDALLDAIDESLRMGLIVSTSVEPEAPFSFGHELVRQTLLARLSPPRRQRLHLRVARAIANAYSSSKDDRAAEIVHHLIRAGADADPTEVVSNLAVAGNRAMKAAAFEEALRYFEEALRRHDPSDRARRANLLSGLADAKRSLGRWDEALVDWRKSMEIYTEIGDTESIGRTSTGMVEALSWAGRYPEAVEIANSGLRQLQGNATAYRARLLSSIAAVYASAGIYRPAQDAVLEAQSIAEQLRDRKLLGEVLGHRSYHDFIFMRLDDAVKEGLESADLLRSEGALWKLAEVLCFVRTGLCQLGRLEDASRIGDEVKPLAEKIGHFGAQMLSIRMQAWTDFCKQPDFVKFEESAHRDLEVTKIARLAPSATSIAQLALTEFLRGNWEGALAHAEEACRIEFPNAWDGFGAGMLFRQKAYLGDRTGALALLDEKRLRLPRLGEPSPLGGWAMLLLIVEGLFVLEERRRAAEFYPLLTQFIDTGAIYIVAVSRFPQTVAGIAAAAGQQWEIAQEHFEISMRAARELPHRLEPAEVQRFYGQMLIERNGVGDREMARNMLTQAIGSYQEFEMSKHVEIARALLNRAG